MYLQHFGLRELPFQAAPNTSFYVSLAGHQEAMNTTLFGLRTGEGFIKITGEVGTGKTILCRTLLRRLGRGFVTAYLPNPAMRPADLALALADELGVPLPSKIGSHELQKYLREILVDIHRHARRTVLVVDEAQTMPESTLESLRLLSNLETGGGEKLLQVVLCGQPELDRKLERHSMRQLQQRIVYSDTLRPIDRAATEGYVKHRLAIAGYSGLRLFTPWALNNMHRASGGIPRLVNLLAHKAMLAACAEDEHAIRRTHVRKAIADTDAIRRWRRVPLIGRGLFGGAS